MEIKLPRYALACGLALGLAVVSPAARQNSEEWSLDLSLYGLAAGMSGDVVVKGQPADLNVGFDTILENLDAAFMGAVRIGYGRWAFTTELLYMELEAEKNSVMAEFEQLMAEPTLRYQLTPAFEVLAGARYNNMSSEINGPFGRRPSGTQDWWDPIVGSTARYPLTQTMSLCVRGDIGGFGIGSELTWQAFPYLDWRFAQWGSLQAGYRWLYMDYEDGSGTGKFSYDVLTQGPQLGITGHF